MKSSHLAEMGNRILYVKIPLFIQMNHKELCGFVFQTFRKVSVHLQ